MPNPPQYESFWGNYRPEEWLRKMTISVAISIPGQTNEHIVCTDAALALPRLAFNPSGDQNVVRIKALAAALAQVIADVRDTVPGAGVVAQEALSMLRTASMTAVYAATTPQSQPATLE